MEERDSPFSGSPENAVSGGGGSAPPATGAGSDGLYMGKKRGRPRKYDAEGNLNPAYVAAAARKAAQAAATPPGFTLTVPENFGVKRGRGKSSGAAVGWQPQQPLPAATPVTPLGEILAHTAGGDFTPYVITVQTGEDVAASIHSFCQKGPRGICILSANGAISNVTIRQPGSSGGLLTYEGRFEILALNGSYTVSEASGAISRNGGLSITLAGPDGRVVGGSVAGWLIAANPVQLVVGSFMPYGFKQKRKYNRDSSNTSAIPAIPESMTAMNPNSQVMHNSAPPHMMAMHSHSPNEADDNSLGSEDNPNSNVHGTPVWNDGSERMSEHRNYPDINISVPGV